MRIKKTSETTPRSSETVNVYSDSTSDAYSCDYVNDLNTYSTNEVRIGTWIDGKPLYRKTIYLSSLPSVAGETTYQHGITNVDKIWMNTSKSMVLFTPSLATTDIAMIPYIKSSNQLVDDFINIYAINRTSYICSVVRDRSNASAYITFEYTKTTD